MPRIYLSSRAVRISRTKSCVTNWATLAQIMKVLFGEQGNSFISFFQRSVRWTVPSGTSKILPRIRQDYVHSFHLIVNSYVLTTRVPLCERVCIHARICGYSGNRLIEQPITICNRDKALLWCQLADYMIL